MSDRPDTYGLMKNTLLALGQKVRSTCSGSTLRSTRASVFAEHTATAHCCRRSARHLHVGMPIFTVEPSIAQRATHSSQRKRSEPSTAAVAPHAQSPRRLLQVCLTRITGLRGHTFMARMHIARKDGGADAGAHDVDARPSDAINMAVRFQAPVYVSKQIVKDLGVPRSHLRDHGVTAASISERSELAVRTTCGHCCLRCHAGHGCAVRCCAAHAVLTMSGH